MDKISQLLSKHSLRQTPCRKEVLQIFFQSPFAIAHSDLESTLKDQHDRVTIYRTLHSFVESGLIHKVPDEKGLKYALCPETCHDLVHSHDHVHFKCVQCDQTTCIEQTHIPNISLPDGYVAQEKSLLVQGICATCYKK